MIFDHIEHIHTQRFSKTKKNRRGGTVTATRFEPHNHLVRKRTLNHLAKLGGSGTVNPLLININSLYSSHCNSNNFGTLFKDMISIEDGGGYSTNFFC